jgi:hypothetical protein
MASPTDDHVYFLHATTNIMRIFFVNNTQDTILLTINYDQPQKDTISIPVGNSNLCLCTSSHIGKARINNRYRGIFLHTQNSHTQMSMKNGKESDFVLNIMLCSSKELPTLLQLSKQFIREQGSEVCNKTRFKLLEKELPLSLAESVCENYKDLKTNNFLHSEGSSKPYFCKCSLFWYAPSQCFSQFGPNTEIKYVKQFHNKKFIGFVAHLENENDD